jgi:hypothetical protein
MFLNMKKLLIMLKAVKSLKKRSMKYLVKKWIKIVLIKNYLTLWDNLNGYKYLNQILVKLQKLINPNFKILTVKKNQLILLICKKDHFIVDLWIKYKIIIITKNKNKMQQLNFLKTWLKLKINSKHQL